MNARCSSLIRRAALCTGLAAVVMLTSVSVATAQPPRDAEGYRNARRLGGSTSFYKPSLTNPASIKRMTNSKGMADDVRKVLSDAGISETSNAVVAMLSSGLPATVLASCTDATPADGVLVECDFQRGATLEWMAYRPNVSRGDRTPARIEKFRWAGRQSFKAFLFRVTDDSHVYTFVVPKECGNLSLMSVQEIRRETPAPPPPAPEAPMVTPPPPAPPVVPEPPATPAPPVMVETLPAVATVKASPFFFDVLVGKDRRVRPIDGRETVDGSPVFANAGGTDFAQCSPLVGFKFGAAKRFQNDWELAGAVGIALSLVNDDKKVREHELFADVELNKYVGGAFIGTGVSLWDVTHSDTVTPAVLVQFGVPLGNHPSHPVYFIGQARMFLDHADDIKNNYLVWGGVRVHF